MWYLYGGIFFSSLVVLFIIGVLLWLLAEAIVNFITDDEDRGRHPLLKKLTTIICFNEQCYDPTDIAGMWFGILLIVVFLWPVVIASCIITLVLLMTRHYLRCKKDGKTFKFKDIFNGVD